MAKDIVTAQTVRVVDNGVEFFTVLETGESGMSASGLARLSGPKVSQKKVSRLLSDLTAFSGPEQLKGLRGKALYLTETTKRGGKAKIIKAEVCATILMYFAFSGHETAFFSAQKFTDIGLPEEISLLQIATELNESGSKKQGSKPSKSLGGQGFVPVHKCQN